MKRKRMLILLVVTLIISNQVTAQLKVLSNGNVGIRNSNPTFDIFGILKSNYYEKNNYSILKRFPNPIV
ncbi:MAG: hypothetical protein LC109_07775 [Bacteroidia bacterium]|nr:hypothetical protein [Bacteroidia bacterium]